MNRDDITRMARAAGLHLATDVNWMPIIGLEYAEKFAALVAAAEREACAKVCEAEAEKWEGKDGPVCFEARLCSYAIRARGNT